MTGHSSGPWQWVNSPDGRKALVSVDEADARLISAAPDLLAALKAALAHVSAPEVLDQMNDAISKAEDR